MKKLFATLTLLLILSSCTPAVNRFIIVNVGAQDSVSRYTDSLYVESIAVKRITKNRNRWRTATVVLGVIVIVAFFPYEEL